MKVHKVSADLIITNTGEAIPNGVIIYDESGNIIDVTIHQDGIGDIQKLKGAICPGFINAHCHLELSHMKGKVPTGTGLIPFIKDVVTKRNASAEQIQEAVYVADQEMWKGGIQAVGDICNTTDTVKVKNASKIAYYSFVEMFDFLQEQDAQSCFEQYSDIYQQMPDNQKDKKSFVPHAPYSVSKNLFSIINSLDQNEKTISIHNQELHAENELFQSKTGGLTTFYNDFNISLDHFSATGKNSIDYVISQLEPTARNLMVHNTVSTEADIMAAHNWNSKTYWVTCPNANLYIENKLPYYQSFRNQRAKMCVGTDSLTSNWQLSMLSEMKIIKRYQSYLEDLDIVKWATLNGADALGFGDLGKLKVGTRPGLVYLQGKIENSRFNLNQIESSQRII